MTEPQLFIAMLNKATLFYNKKTKLDFYLQTSYLSIYEQLPCNIGCLVIKNPEIDTNQITGESIVRVKVMKQNNLIAQGSFIFCLTMNK